VAALSRTQLVGGGEVDKLPLSNVSAGSIGHPEAMFSSTWLQGDAILRIPS